MRLALVGWLALLATNARAADVIVGPTGQFPTIQEGIDFANDFDRVLIEDGVYVEDLYILTRTLTIEGMNGSGAVTVMTPAGPYSYHAVEVASVGTVDLIGLTIDGDSAARALFVSFGADVTLDDVHLINGYAVDGYPGGNLGLWQGATVTLSDTDVVGGSTAGWYGGLGGNIAAEYGSQVVLDGDVNVTSGIAEVGGGLYIDSSSYADIWLSTFYGNQSVGYGDGGGGAILVDSGGTLLVDASTFIDNTAPDDGLSAGGAIWANGSGHDIVGSLFDGNFAHMGGAIALDDGEATVSFNSFLNNSADKGGGVACISQSGCDLTANWFVGNAAGLGGGMWMWDSFSPLRENVFCHNDAVDPDPMVGQGGGLYASEGETILRNNVFVANEASFGGGGVRTVDSNLDSRNNHYVGNSSGTVGGGLMASEWGLLISADSVNDLYLDNQAVDWAGVVLEAGLLNNLGWGWMWANTPSHTNVLIAPTTQMDVADPALNGYAPGFCSLWGLRPSAISPLINAGDPLVFDPDGSRSDIGAFGGPDAPGDLFDDLDGDLVPGMQDCNDLDPGVAGGTLYWIDNDGDGFGTGDPVAFCDQPGGWSPVGGDCDDNNPKIVQGTAYYPDADGDGFGAPVLPTWACDGKFPDMVLNNEDCDDSDASLNPETAWYEDTDLDGFGVGGAFYPGCEPGEGWSRTDDDCGPDDFDVNPKATKLCDHKDNDCNGLVDDGMAGQVEVWVDADGDGWGDLGDGRLDCAGWEGTAPRSGDCDDGDPEVHPDAVDRFDDGVDGDCDGHEARTWIVGGACDGCDVQGSGGSGWLLGMTALLALRRRR